ncbi:MAG: hypothetical protein ACREOC_16665 [Gemmatimonadales bacterium]
MSIQAHAEADAAIRKWFRDNGVPVTTTHEDFDRDVFSWRHEPVGSRSLTLRISQSVLEDLSETDLVSLLNSQRVMDLLRKAPDRYTIVCRGDRGDTVVRQLAERPE